MTPVKPSNCTCSYPDVVFRNINGHAMNCPVYSEWAAKFFSKSPENDCTNYYRVDFKAHIKPLLAEGFEVIKIYDDGTGGANEVARVRLSDGTEIVTKVMLAIKKYHQRRKALTEIVNYLLSIGLGGNRVVKDMYAEMYYPTEAYEKIWGKENIEGHKRVCQVIREYAPGVPGDTWRGKMYSELGDLDRADEHCRQVIEQHPDAERISVLDFLTINQDRSARNWVTEYGARFYAIDNGMAWFHEFPDRDKWRAGCVIEDVILQREPWQFISGVFTTSYAGRPLSAPLLECLRSFDEAAFLAGVDEAAQSLEFPAGLSEDWRFEGILRRLRWMADKGRQPTADEYRSWHAGSEMMTPPEIVDSGGKMVWTLEMDYA